MSKMKTILSTELPTFEIEMRGTITRDIQHFECDAKDEAEVRAIFTRLMPTYRVHYIGRVFRNKLTPEPPNGNV